MGAASLNDRLAGMAQNRGWRRVLVAAAVLLLVLCLCCCMAVVVFPRQGARLLCGIDEEFCAGFCRESPRACVDLQLTPPAIEPRP